VGTDQTNSKIQKVGIQRQKSQLLSGRVECILFRSPVSTLDFLSSSDIASLSFWRTGEDVASHAKTHTRRRLSHLAKFDILIDKFVDVCQISLVHLGKDEEMRASDCDPGQKESREVRNELQSALLLRFGSCRECLLYATRLSPSRVHWHGADSSTLFCHPATVCGLHPSWSYGYPCILTEIANALQAVG
jgi:hypothetical protein